MNQSALTKVLVENLVDKYLPKLQFDPQRSIRKLVDLGECLSHGKVQKHFFQVAQSLLSREDSPYYTVVQRIINQVNPRTIKTIGMNLGLNSWSALSRRPIREEAPPWTLLFHLDSTPDALSMEELISLIRESASLGIHTFLFWLDRSYSALDELMARIRSFSDCAFAFFTPAGLVNGPALHQAEQSSNLLLSIEDAPGDDPEPATRALRGKHCPYALHTIYRTPSEAENILCGRWLERVNHLLSPFAFFLPGADCPEESHQAVREYARRLRTAPVHPVFSMSLCDDISDVDERITGKPRLLQVQSNGLLTPDRRMTLGNIRTSLTDVLRQYNPSVSAIE